MSNTNNIGIGKSKQYYGYPYEVDRYYGAYRYPYEVDRYYRGYRHPYQIDNYYGGYRHPYEVDRYYGGYRRPYEVDRYYGGYTYDDYELNRYYPELTNGYRVARCNPPYGCRFEEVETYKQQKKPVGITKEVKTVTHDVLKSTKADLHKAEQKQPNKQVENKKQIQLLENNPIKVVERTVKYGKGFKKHKQSVLTSSCSSC